jgi:hypothetical protein
VGSDQLVSKNFYYINDLNITQYNKKIMSVIILVPATSNKSTYHFGSSSNDNVDGGYFIKTDDEKKVVSKPVYKPDSLYSTNDGYVGRCWIVTLTDVNTNDTQDYNYRNFVDLNDYMVGKGYQNFAK